MRLRLLVASLAAIGGVAVSPSAWAAGSAIQPGNRPTPLTGAENGYVPAGRLITVAPGCRVAREAGPSAALLFRTAKAVGVPLTGRDCYRPLSGQVAQSRSWTARGNSACAAAPSTGTNGKPKGTSMHGWGKAIDFGDPGGMRFGSVGYRYLKAQAARLGWNHPGWAEPGGSTCPEPWHWEWVGDGGTAGADPVRSDMVGLVPAAGDAGYLKVTGLGALHPAGNARSSGSAESVPLNWVVVGAAPTPDRGGYWLLAGDGGIFSFGDAVFHGSTGAMRLNSPVVGMAATPTGRGYWLVASDGGIFSFGDAVFHGSTGGMRLNAPVVGMAATPTGRGYWLVASDGGIFSFGDARFVGSTGDRRSAAPVVGMAPAHSGAGYWVLASDGTVFPFGDALPVGSVAGLRTPAVGITPTATGGGYWVVAADGTVVARGGAGSFG
jgi:hypothetical protein